MTGPIPRKPSWLKARLPSGEQYRYIKSLVGDLRLNTVCEEARCPNVGECWNAGTATFMILGDTCTRSCGFCNVKTGRPPFYDENEPYRVAEAISRLNLKHAVITSVDRDELEDKGSWVFGETIREVRRRSSGITIEVLIPDFQGLEWCQDQVFEAAPEILNHNMETVPRLYRTVRPQARYEWSLNLLDRAKSQFNLITKTGLMVGLGETKEELFQVLEDLAKIHCDILTIGQYLQPTPKHLPVARYVPPEEFDEYKAKALGLGFRHVESGPLVRSSYHAADAARPVELLQVL